MKQLICIFSLVALVFCGCAKSGSSKISNQSGEINRPATMPVPVQTTEGTQPSADTAPTVNTAPHTIYYVVNCKDSIPMYTAPDAGSNALCFIPLGTSVSYIQTAQNGFYNIAYQGTIGYAFAENLSLTPPDTTSTYATYYVVNCNENITLRVAPSTEADAICTIPLGASVSMIGTAENGFYKVVYTGQTGYALASYLSQDPKSHSTPQDTVDLNGNYTTCYVVNCQQSITLRTSPSTTASEICQIPLGASVSYVSTASNDFYRVIFNGQVGYALSSYLSFSRPLNPYDGYYLQVVNCRESITLRISPSTSALGICQIPLGAYVEFYDYAENGFYLVGYNGYTGYALSNYLY